MAKTRTGSFPVGFRRGWEQWQRDLGQLVSFAKDNDFAFIDFGPSPAGELKQVVADGVKVGAIDLKDWKDLASPDAGRRRAAAQANAQYVAETARLGAGVFLAVIIPEDPVRPRRENFGFAVDGYGQLMPAVEAAGAKVVLEGWPGSAPHYASIACTPADCRAFFREVGSAALGVNYDPSHLVRMGIDPVRFASEFAPRVFHAHAKDTELLADGLYEHGHTQPATSAAPRQFGGYAWRYAIPGRGHVPWGRALAALHDAGYRGLLAIELEDEEFNGTREGEQRALVQSRDYLAGV